MIEFHASSRTIHRRIADTRIAIRSVFSGSKSATTVMTGTKEKQTDLKNNRDMLVEEHEDDKNNRKKKENFMGRERERDIRGG